MLKSSRSLSPFFSFIIAISLVFSGLNPVCQYSSTSKMLMEICSGDGIKTIEVGVADFPGPPGGDRPSNSHKKCSFCFSSQMVKLLPESHLLDTPHRIAYNVYDFSKGDTVLKFPGSEKYEARAPPVLT